MPIHIEKIIHNIKIFDASLNISKKKYKKYYF